MTTKTATQVALQMALNAPDNEKGELLRRLMGVNLPMGQQIHLLHLLMDTPAPYEPKLLSVSDRHQRLHYIMSEFLELVEASGFYLMPAHIDGNFYSEPLTKSTLLLIHEEGSKQNVIEMVDGIEDIMVVSLGMLAEMGQLVTHQAAFREVVAGSVTKLNPDTGVIDKNHCRYSHDVNEPASDETQAHCRHQLRAIGEGNMDFVCDDPTHRPVPDEPVGKWIKGKDYTPPNLAAIIKLPEGYES